MPDDPPVSQAEPKPPTPAPAQGLGCEIGVALVPPITLLLAFAVATMISALFPGPDHWVGDFIGRVVIVYWALVAAELIAGIALRAALGRVAAGNALLIGALLSAALLGILGILAGVC